MSTIFCKSDNRLMGGLFFWCKLLHPPMQAGAVAFYMYIQSGSDLVPAGLNCAAQICWEPVDYSRIVCLMQEGYKKWFRILCNKETGYDAAANWFLKTKYLTSFPMCFVLALLVYLSSITLIFLFPGKVSQSKKCIWDVEGIITLAYGSAPHLQITTFTFSCVIVVCLGNTKF